MEDKNFSPALHNAIIDGDEAEAMRIAEAALNAGIDPLSLVNESIQTALEKVGNQFQSGQLFLPELILAGDAATAALNIIKPKLTAGSAGNAVKASVVIGTIQGDLHDIGKNVVGALLTAHGFHVIDLGTDVSPKKFVEAAEREDARVIAISSLLTTAMPYHQDVIRLLADTGKRAIHFVIVGGGPVNLDWAAKIGADGYGRDARDAVLLCQSLFEQNLQPPLEKPLSFGSLK